MNKFEYANFIDINHTFMVNAEKYSEVEAVQIFEKETACEVGFKKGCYGVHLTYLRWDSELKVKSSKESCKVYVFSRV